MDRQKLVAKIDACKADIRASRQKLADAERSRDRARVTNLQSSQRYNAIELNRLAHELAEMDSLTVAE